MKDVPLVEISANWNHIIFAGKSAQKPLKRGYFMDAASTRKHLKIHNLTTTDAALMKHIIIMYLRKTFNLAEDWGVTHRE